MAKLVNAQEKSYSELDKLKNVHTSLLKEINRELKKTKKLVEDKEEFHIEKTSKKVQKLIETYEKKILPGLEKSFEISETSVATMEKMLIEKDKISL